MSDQNNHTKKANLFSRIKAMLSNGGSSAEENNAQALETLAEETSQLTEHFNQQLAAKADAETMQQLRNDFNALKAQLDQEERPPKVNYRSLATGEDVDQSKPNYPEPQHRTNC